MDGYPRDVVQAEWLVKNGVAEKIKKAILIKVPKEILLERIKKRGRADDTDEVIKRRFEIVEQNIYTILSLLKTKNVEIVEIDGRGTIEEIERKIEEVIE